MLLWLAIFFILSLIVAYIFSAMNESESREKKLDRIHKRLAEKDAEFQRQKQEEE